VETAAHLAAANQGRLFILHVLESASIQNRRWVKHYETGENMRCDTAYEKKVREQLEATYAKAIEDAPVSEVRVATGYPWEQILHWSRQAGTDLIVMGPHSSRAFEKGVVRVAGQVGSTLEGVIRREKCPTLVVNQQLSHPVNRFERILVGIDFSAACECALCFAGQLAKYYNAKVFAFHMIPIPPYPKYTAKDYEADRDSAEERMRYFCREYLEDTHWSCLIKGGALPHIELLGCAERVDADLIVLGSHTRQTEGKWYPGSAVERVSYRSTCPVMVINDPQALLPWQNMQQTLAKDKGPKDRHIHLFTART
jgi:nucleotide-binding universal stress UspA family protein